MPIPTVLMQPTSTVTKPTTSNMISPPQYSQYLRSFYRFFGFRNGQKFAICKSCPQSCVTAHTNSRSAKGHSSVAPSYYSPSHDSHYWISTAYSQNKVVRASIFGSSEIGRGLGFTCIWRVYCRWGLCRQCNMCLRVEQ